MLRYALREMLQNLPCHKIENFFIGRIETRYWKLECMDQI